MIDIKPISVFELYHEGEVLFAQHYEELTLHKEIVKLNIDWKKYQQLESLEIFKAIGMWEDYKLIGYSAFFITTHLHYKNLKTAMNDILFLKKEKRKGVYGIKLIRESQKMLEAEGVQKITWHCKYDTALGPLLEKLGYNKEEFSMSKIVR